jgi:hypothetical protein
MTHAAFAAPGAKPPSPSDEIIVADRIRTAFYERAPRSVRDDMRRALVAACEAGKKDPPTDYEGNPVDIERICNGQPLAFLREVIVTGPKLREGWVCVDEDLERFRYILLDMIRSGTCVKANYDYDTRRITVDLAWRPDPEV